MKRWIGILGLCVLLWAEEKKEVVDCNLIFESRKEEISAQLKKLEEQQQSLMILQNATENVLKERQDILDGKYKEFEEKQKSFEDSVKQTQENLKKQEEESQKRLASQKQEIEKLIAKNEELLKEIRGERKNKIIQAYAKMKDAKAAEILQSLPLDDVVAILGSMDTKIVGKILSKMDPQKAGEVTLMIQNTGSEKIPPTPNP